MFPISDSEKSARFPLITLFLIALNIYVFFQEMSVPNVDAFITEYALIPSQIDFNNVQSLFAFVTSMFLHGGIFHIVSNMWFLYIFGDNVEGRFGRFGFLMLYLFAGVVGNFAQYILNTTSTIPMLGASGAVSGVLGAYYLLFPHSKIKTIVVLFFFLTVVQIPAVIYLLYWFVLQLFQGVSSLSTLTTQTGGVAFWAHIGGFLTGMFFGRGFKNSDKKGFIEGEIV